MPKQNDQTQVRGHPASSSNDLLAAVEREAAFYRDLLEKICQDTRMTRARRLADSGLMFWDQMKKEAQKCHDQGDGYWDCAKLDSCVKPQCSDCPQIKAANAGTQPPAR